MPRIALLAAALLLAGCQTARYEPKGEPGSFGYSSQSTSARRFVVMFEGDPVTGFFQARDFALLRAAELTRKAGGTHFRVITERSLIKSRFDEVQIPESAKYPRQWDVAPQSKTLLMRREYPVVWFEIEFYTDTEPVGGPTQTDVFDAAGTQELLVKKYRLKLPDQT